jgi:dTDP-4-dehydrorhamnose reductase
VRILVTGAGGLLGSLLVVRARARGLDVSGLTRSDLDVTDPRAVRAAIAAAAFDWVVHCAAYTDVDRAEAEPEVAWSVNAGGTRLLAEAAAEASGRLVYVSTDYVFDGRKRTPYRVGDRPNPLSTYARSKLAGEREARRAYRARAAWGIAPTVVRTGWLYGSDGRGFVRAILERARSGEVLRVVDDQVGRPTRAANVADVVLDLMAHGAAGTWHVADRGTATWLDLAREALRVEGVDAEVEGTSTEAWGAAAPRPAWSVLDLDRTEAALGRAMEEWKTALEECLRPTSTGPAPHAATTTAESV